MAEVRSALILAGRVEITSYYVPCRSSEVIEAHQIDPAVVIVRISTIREDWVYAWLKRPLGWAPGRRYLLNVPNVLHCHAEYDVVAVVKEEGGLLPEPAILTIAA